MIKCEGRMRWVFGALVVYFFLSGVYWVAGNDRGSVFGRAGPAELWLIVMIGIAAWMGKGRWRFSKASLGLLVFLFAAIISAALAPGGNVLTVLAVISAGPVAWFVIVHIGSYLTLEQRVNLLRWWVYSGGVVALVGIWDYVAVNYGLPSIPRPSGYEATRHALSGTFRNSGQAGTFYFVLYLVALPLAIAESSVKDATNRHRLFSSLAAGACAAALFLSFKRAGIVGAVIGTLGVLLVAVKARMLSVRLIVVIAALFCGGWVYSMFLDDVEELRNRQEYKARRAQGLLDDDSFWVENLRDAVQMFVENPWFGVGTGNAGSRTSTGHEIHSSYFAIAAEMGLVGLGAWLIMMMSLWRATNFRVCVQNSALVREFRRFIPVIWMSLLVAFIYIQHLRKREFWITMAVLTLLGTGGLNRRQGNHGLRNGGLIE